ncbi:hypothetical protein [Thioflexithrix psekupsensis]|uniref:DUF2281 domain-containing protein n=1 Tax=Thioflexithrix psekupsensis TaxID=1570016 RepID=A0A251X4G9_9GAMM|nr:hypothetical protein [Thioflexithrix psekupsensis]OUD12089.1 hypothetical protein TPSD3_13235 [Thioflexithrix psekupsensis]
MSDLDLIAQIDKKIQQLPSEAAIQVNEYVDSLLQTYLKQSEMQLDSLDEWTKSLVGLIPENTQTEELLRQEHQDGLLRKYQ